MTYLNLHQSIIGSKKPKMIIEVKIKTSANDDIELIFKVEAESKTITDNLRIFDSQGKVIDNTDEEYNSYSDINAVSDIIYDRIKFFNPIETCITFQEKDN